MIGKIKYFLGKITIFIAGILLLTIIVFFISRLTPLDPLQAYYGDRIEKMSAREKNEARERLGLNENILAQYFKWLNNALKGDFGISYKYKQSALEVIGERTGNTLLLGGIGYLIIFFGSMGLGLLCARREGSLFDRIVCKLGTILSCVPEFWLALVLILIFSVSLRLLPSSGAYSVAAEAGAGGFSVLWDRIRHLLLPLSVVVLEHLWYYACIVRNRCVEEIREGYVLMGRAIGLTEGRIIYRHCLRNLLPSYLSIMAIAVPHILGGTYIVETVFSYPGIGSLAYESARYADYNMLMLICVITGIIVIFFNMLAQLINEHIDPRIRAGRVTALR